MPDDLPPRMATRAPVHTPFEANRAAIDERKGEGAGGVEWTKPPVGRHYEGTLLLTTAEGA